MGTNNEGSRATIIQNGNANIFSIVLKRYAKGPDGNKETATITTTDPRPACFEGVGQKFQFDGQLHIGPCTRPVSNQEVAVTVNLIRVSKVLTSIFRQPVETLRRPSEAHIVEIAVPANSSDQTSRPRNENTWALTFPVNDTMHIEVGYMVEPEPFYRNWGTDFAMHDHQYKAPNIPDPQRANILFRFNKSVRVADLVIIQHSNGVAEVEGWVGDSKDNMRSIGTATSSLAQAA